MASGKSAYLEAALLDHVYGDTAYTPPATIYFALSTSAWDPAATGSAMDEVAGGSYARQPLTNNTTDFPNATGADPAVKTTGAAVDFPTATADWGTVLSWYAVDASSAGNCLHGGDFPAPIPVAIGGSVSAPAGNVLIREN